MDDYNEMNITETKKETDKKCPQCGGVMDFDPASGNLKCPYCEYEETIKQEEAAPAKAEELDFTKAEHTANRDWGVATKTVLCKSCGAESIYDLQQTAAVCPFCGSNQVMDAADEDTIAPGGVVPFSISDKEASELFHKWISKKWFCPKLAKESAKPKAFKGIYLPYWTFDTDTFTSYRGEYGIDKTTRDKNGNTKTVTSWHSTSGTHREFINDALVFASKNHDMTMLRQLEPFDTENNKTYNPKYIAGFVAERYSLGLKDAWVKAQGMIKNTLKNNITHKITRQHRADRVRNLTMTTQHSNITYKHLLLPIWVSNFKYNDKVYQFMVNGQTGKVAGKTPLSIPKIIITAIAVIVLLILLHKAGMI